MTLRTSFSQPSRSAVAGLALAVMMGAVPAFANGGHASDTGTAPPPAKPSKAQGAADDLTTCPKGQLWDTRAKKCVRMRSDALPDDLMADNGYALAKAGRYEEALAALDLMRDGNTAEALNYRGYATRKLGRTDEGIAFYLRSVALDPHYPKVREYLGEAYVIKGRVDLAKEQLGTIKALCGIDCEPYRDLSDAIAKAHAL